MIKDVRYRVKSTVFRGIPIAALRFFLVLSLFLHAGGLSAQIQIAFSVVRAVCAGSPSGRITASASGGTAPYSYKWSNGGMTATINDLVAGTYIVTVTDANANTKVDSATVMEPPMVQVAFSTSGACQAPVTVTATASGGRGGPYTYKWDGGVEGQTITVTQTGKYCVTVSDSYFCAHIECIAVTVDPIRIDLQAQPVTCPDGNDGKVTSTVSGGQAPYIYKWSNGATTANLGNVPPGNYSVTVTDAGGCAANTSVVVPNQTPITVSIDSRGPSCPGEFDGYITITKVTGGTPPYTYAWNTGQSRSSITQLGAGLFIVTITDSKGCPTVRQVNLQTRSNLRITIAGKDETCPGAKDGAVSVTALDGVLPYQYLWSNGSASATQDKLAPGTYSVTVTDGAGCKKSASVQIAAATPLDVSFTKTDISTCGGKDGVAQATVTQGTGPFTYKWSTGATTTSLTGLGPGVYSVTVKDAKGCEKTGSLTIAEPPAISVRITGVPSLCAGEQTGALNAIVSGGTAPFTYKWNTGATTPSIESIGPGSYSVTVKDSKNCEATASVPILEIIPPQVDIIAGEIVCGGGAGAARASASGGKAPYSYKWNTGATSPNISNLGTGAYSVTITDANGCRDTASVSIEVIPPINLKAVAQNIICSGTASGSISAEASGGKAPLSYSWNTGAKTSQITGLKAGNYAVTVEDAAGCTATATASVAEPPALIVSAGTDSRICSGTKTGKAQASARGGVGPYTFAWSTGATTSSLDGLVPGQYIVTATDANGCQASDTLEIIGSPAPQVAISAPLFVCGGQNTGVAEAKVSSGTGPFSFTWSTGATGFRISNLGTGTYRVTVTDAAGCVGNDSVSIKVVPAIALSATPRQPVCAGDTTGSALATATGGEPPFNFRWNTGASGPELKNVKAGTYTFTVTDAANCTASATVVIRDVPPLVLNLSSKDVECGAKGTAIAVVKASGGTPPYNYLWSNGVAKDTLSGIPAGDYTVTVTDASGCEKTGQVRILDPGAPQCNLVVSKAPTSPTASDGEITAVVTGGVAPYQYRWSNGQTGATATGLTSGSYEVTITDAKGCRTTCSIAMSSTTALVGDFVWHDRNRNGVQEPGEEGIPGIVVILTNTKENKNDTTRTGADGRYLFVVQPGMYKITFNLPDTLTITKPDAVSNDSIDSDVDRNTKMTIIFTMDPGEIDLTWDAGVYNPCVNITDPGQIGYNQDLCGPGFDPAPLVSIRPASGGSGELEYLWMSSVTAGPFDPGYFSPIPNSNSPTYDPGPVNQTTYFARCARRVGCPNFLEPDIVAIKVLDQAKAELIARPLYCFNENINLKAETKSPDASVKWEFSDGVQPQVAYGKVVTLRPARIGRVDVKITVTENNCTITTTGYFIITDSPSYCSGTDLPLEAQLDNRTISAILRWRLLDDNLGYTFEVQEAPDSAQFRRIGIVSKPITTADGFRYYEFIDQEVKPGRNFYRVMATDAFGNRVFSNLASILVQPEGSGSETPQLVFVYPNPTSDILNIDFLQAAKKSMHIDILHSSGKMIRSAIMSKYALRGTIDVSDLPAGVYFIRVQIGEDKVETVRMVKQ